jgi:hypothetical protein
MKPKEVFTVKTTDALVCGAAHPGGAQSGAAALRLISRNM